jgi:hypothetical protein
MHPFSTHELVAAWDDASALPACERPLALLAASCPEHDRSELEQLSVGTRDALLLTQRERAFGSRVVSLADCPRCAQTAELAFDVRDVRLPAGPRERRLAVRSRGYRLVVDVPTAADFEAAARQPGEPEAIACLLERCVVSAKHGGEDVSPSALPRAVVAALERRLTKADPQADVELEASCAGCGQSWLAPFDIGSFFWSEIEAWALRVLSEVHRLALAYGWREPDVLALSPRRRNLYLEIAGT